MFYEDEERPATGRRREEEEGGGYMNGNASPRPSTASRDARANRANQLATKRKERSSIGINLSSFIPSLIYAIYIIYYLKVYTPSLCTP
jgi:hypothetical protein